MYNEYIKPLAKDEKAKNDVRKPLWQVKKGIMGQGMSSILSKPIDFFSDTNIKYIFSCKLRINLFLK